MYGSLSCFLFCVQAFEEAKKRLEMDEEDKKKMVSGLTSQLLVATLVHFILGVPPPPSACYHAYMGFPLLLLHDVMRTWGSPYSFCMMSCVHGVPPPPSACYHAYMGFPLLLLHDVMRTWGSPSFCMMSCYHMRTHVDQTCLHITTTFGLQSGCFFSGFSRSGGGLEALWDATKW